MGKLLEKYVGSVRFWILMVASVYLAYALYFAVYGLNFSLDLIHQSIRLQFGNQKPVAVDNPLLWQ